MLKRWCAPVILLVGMTGYGGTPEMSAGDEMLSAYADMQYIQARQLADKHPQMIEARLVNALCDVFDRRQQDIAHGLPELKKIYADTSIRPSLRVEAGLAYARAVQTLQMRPGVYPMADDIDFNKIYNEIIAANPAAPAAVFAAIYQAQGWFDSKNEKEIAQGFTRLHDILKSYAGPKKYLSPVNYMLADQYIINGNRYDLAVRHLEAARELGIANPRNKEQVQFRIARIYDFYLHDAAAAELNYQRFIQEFPNSANAPIARRYMDALKKGVKETGNGK